MRRRQLQSSKSRLNPVQEKCRRKFVENQELPRETERISAQGLSGGETRMRMRIMEGQA